jgi:glucose-6-phosphate 1-epimerase
MATEIEALNTSFAIGDLARLVAGQSGLPKVQITSPAASAEIYLHGAQVTAWRPSGSEEVIFTSEHSRWEEGKAIRGGIPVCFPWFRGKADDPKAPAHGVVRTKSWTLESLAQKGDSICVTLATESDESTRRWWPHDFRLTLSIQTGAQLELELTVSNTGATAFQFEEALHTYHCVGDVRRARVAGLNGVSFLDNRDGNREKIQNGDVVMVDVTDNAYLNTASSLMIADPILQRRIQIEKQNSLTTVVWNPWDSGAKALADLGDDEWQRMICVEASNILSSAVILAPGEEHRMTTTISVIERGD